MVEQGMNVILVIVLVVIFRRLKMWHRLYFVPSGGANIK